MAGHAAGDGPAQRADHAQPDRIVRKDIGADADARLRRLDVRDQAVDGPVILVQQLDGIAADGRKIAEALRERCDLGLV